MRIGQVTVPPDNATRSIDCGFGDGFIRLSGHLSTGFRVQGRD